VAILLIDARKGVLVQTRRHAYLARLMGIRNLALAVNKMDLVGYDPTVFEAIRTEFLTFVRQLGPLRVEAIPLSALQNENLLTPSSQMPWYEGPTLLHYLETVEARPQGEARVILPVQMSLRPDGHFRGVIGTLASGTIRPGDALCATTSGQTARIASMVAMEGPIAEAKAGDAVTLQLDREIDVSRGEVLTSPDAQVEMTDQFEATIVWMHEEPGLIGRRYELKLATQWASASITSIKYRIDVNTLAHEPARQMVLNDICVCNLSASRALPLDSFERSRELGSFLLVDRYSNATVAAGMIRHSLRRAHNIHPHEMTVTREARERLQGHAGKVVWFTGLSGAGKSTIANEVEKALHAQGRRTYLLDGDNLRNGLNRDLGFTEADRVENIRRVAEVARLMQDAGLIVLVAIISPFRQEREMARRLIGEEHFLEVYVNAPLDVCEARDPKGLYQKARRGEIPNLTGVQAPYEPPLDSQLELRTGEASLEECVASVLALLEASSLR
jgi:bifunctional enzyme CysN/CysC